MINRLLLYVITRNKSNMNYEILSTDSESINPLTTELMPNYHIQNQCQLLFDKYIKGYENNVFTFLDIDITDTLDIVYFCFVPFGIKPEISYFLPIKQNEIFIKHIRQILNVA